jgi:predicted dehydrogenase
VRWTEQRNFEAVLGALEAERLQVDDLITNRFALADAVEAYETVRHDRGTLGVILEYPPNVCRTPAVVTTRRARVATGSGLVGVIGAGNFAKAILLPALKETPAKIGYVADLDPAAARHAAIKFAAAQAATDYRIMLDDPQVGAVFIVVEHHLHAKIVCESLGADKHVFVEKPLALSGEEMAEVAEAAEKAKDRLVMVGFNRRFSPHTVKIKELLAGRSEPLCMNMTVNAGFVPPQHWVQDPERGGGRILGEGCHFIDLLAHLSGSPVASVHAVMIGDRAAFRADKMSIALSFGDGSVGTVNYFANGSKRYPKESLEVFSDGRVLRMENFRVTRGYGFRQFHRFKTWRQDKGHRAEIAAFIARAFSGGKPLISFDQLQNTTLAALAAVESARTGKVITL